MNKKYLYVLTFIQILCGILGIILIVRNILGSLHTDNLFLFVALTILAIYSAIEKIIKIKEDRN